MNDNPLNIPYGYVTKFFEPESLEYFNAGSLRFGSLKYYSAEGNRQLLGFVTFNTQKLIQAVVEIMERQYGLKRETANLWMINGPVEYGARHHVTELSSGQRNVDWNPIFSKPIIFRPENEFRIALNKDHPRNVASEEDGFNLVGPEIISAMCFEPRLIDLTSGTNGGARSQRASRFAMCKAGPS